MTGDTAFESVLTTALEDRDAVAFVHAGSDRDPAIRYCRLYADEDRGEGSTAIEPYASAATETYAIGFDGTDWYSVSSDESTGHPAEALAEPIADRIGTGTLLTPARLPHDAALYLEAAGFSLASTTVVERARATKTPAEIDRIAAGQAAASAGVRRGAALLAETTVENGSLVADGTVVTPERLRRTIDEGIVAAGGFPCGGTTSIPTDGPLEPGEPIVLSVAPWARWGSGTTNGSEDRLSAPRETPGYYGGLTRTLVVDSEGGRERRAHVGVTQAFRSVQAMLTADSESVTAVEADLEAEIRAFGFGDEETIETQVSGVGLEPIERPRAGGDVIEPGTVVRVAAGVELAPDRWVRLADVLAVEADGVRWLDAPSRSIDPAALSE